MIARKNDDARLAVGVERRVVLARSDLVAKASMGMSCFGTMYTYLVRRSCPSLARIESDGDGLPLVQPLARRTGSLPSPLPFTAGELTLNLLLLRLFLAKGSSTSLDSRVVGVAILRHWLWLEGARVGAGGLPYAFPPASPCKQSARCQVWALIHWLCVCEVSSSLPFLTKPSRTTSQDLLEHLRTRVP
jgi:hypothetical protein